MRHWLREPEPGPVDAAASRLAAAPGVPVPEQAGELPLMPRARNVRVGDRGQRNLLEEARGEVERTETQMVAPEMQQCSGTEAEPPVLGQCSRLVPPRLQHSKRHPVGLVPQGAVEVVAAPQVLVS